MGAIVAALIFLWSTASGADRWLQQWDWRYRVEPYVSSLRDGEVAVTEGCTVPDYVLPPYLLEEFGSCRRLRDLLAY